MEERNMMKRALEPFGLDPRCLKRMSIVFKLLKVIWYMDPFHAERDKEEILFMMLLASDITTRDVTFRIFDWMEPGSIQYHLVVQDDQGKLVRDLAALFLAA